MKKILALLCLVTGVMSSYAQEPADTLQEKLSAIDGKLNALDERVAVNESDLGKLIK
jgi:hypothetical protein